MKTLTNAFTKAVLILAMICILFGIGIWGKPIKGKQTYESATLELEQAYDKQYKAFLEVRKALAKSKINDYVNGTATDIDLGHLQNVIEDPTYDFCSLR